jgi:hypothetical protein
MNQVEDYENIKECALNAYTELFINKLKFSLWAKM